MSSLASQSLSRTSSVSSVASDNSIVSSSANTSSSIDTLADNSLKRTRKRFTSAQLMMLEHLYGRVSHPTREQREEVAREADIDIRSVTVWFQNKRQTDRRISRQLSEAPPGLSLQPAPSPSPSLSHSHPQSSPTSLFPPSSPFSDASGKTIHTVRARTRTLSWDSSTSAVSVSAMSRKREREHEGDAHRPPARHIRRKPSRHLSLDDVAARAERPALLPRTPPQAVVASQPSSSPVQSATSEPKLALSAAATAGAKNENDENDEQGRERALWENMPSSPIAPNESLPPHSERDIVRYAGKRRITLEYACARETVGVKEWEWRWLDGRDGARMRSGREREKKSSKSRHRRRHHDPIRKRAPTEVSSDGHRQSRPYAHSYTQAKEQDEEEPEVPEEDIPVAEYDVYGGGDTDTEGAPSEPPVTPSSSFSLGELRTMDADEADDGDSDRTVTVHQEVLGAARGKDEPMAVPRIQGGPDDDLMDVAYVLCGLRRASTVGVVENGHGASNS